MTNKDGQHYNGECFNCVSISVDKFIKNYLKYDCFKNFMEFLC